MFGEKLKELRVEKEYSQSKLAQKLNVSKQNISDWENGKSETSFEMLVRIAKLFDVTTDFLLGLED